MANALSGILQGARSLLQGTGDVAKDVHGGVRDWGRRYTYGPNYEEDQDLKTRQVNARIASDEALAAWRLADGRGGGGVGGAKALMTEHKNLTSHRDDLQKQYDASESPEEEARLKSEIARFNKQIGGIAEQLWPTQPEPGNSRAPGPPIGVDDSTALGYPPQSHPSVFNQPPQGALGGIAQPPRTAGNIGQPGPAMNDIAMQAQKFLEPSPLPGAGGIANPAQQPVRPVPQPARPGPGTFGGFGAGTMGVPPSPAAVGGQAPGPPIGGVDSAAIGIPPQAALGNIDGPQVPDPAAIANTIKTLEAMKQESAGNPEDIKQIDNLINMAVNAARGIPAQSQPGVFNQPPGAPSAQAQSPSIPAQSPSTPPQRALPDTAKVTPAEPSSKEQFEQVVSQMAKTDRPAAKAFYKKWANRWQ